MEMHAFGTLVPALTARRRLLAATRPIGRTETVRVTSAFDRVSAATVRAPAPVPAFLRATWDGYAVRSDDTRSATARQPATLRVVGDVYAEGRLGRRLGRGEAVAIATGGALPRGADTVVIFEEVDRTDGAVRVRRPIRPGDRLARPGDDIPRGARLVRRGDLLAPAELGGLAACGVATVRVYARPVVTVIPNGNELSLPGAPRRAGTVYESNNATLAAVIEASGALPRLRPPVADDPARIEAELRTAIARSDLVIATGGSSVGERDHLPRIFPRLGTLLFHGVAVRPGKPTLAARAGDTLVIGLPGHPTSCLANMLWLVLPALRRLARRPGPGWTEEWATLGADAIAPTPGMATVVPFELRDGRAFSTFRGSSSITSLRGATAFALLPPGRRRVRAGERIRLCRLTPPLGRGA
ncbi:MAG TPA: molybdopterin molybdotransferase MoeA [Thermoplasmata archaeon]|nr:molybdopterin molybdotransferase MoeA [Thermoplasmata archaeon]